VHQSRADTPSLVLVYDGKSQLSLPGLDDHVTSAADKHWSPLFLHHCDQGYVSDEVNIYEKLELAIHEFQVGLGWRL
jgi:hypothetical protein